MRAMAVMLAEDWQVVIPPPYDCLSTHNDVALPVVSFLQDINYKSIVVIVTVVQHDFRLTLSFILLSPTLQLHSLILSFPLSYLFT